MKKNGMVVALVCVFTCNVFANSVDLALQNKKNAEEKHLTYLKNKLSICKASKAPFAKISGIKPLLLFTGVGLAVLYYVVSECNENVEFQHEFLRRKIMEEDSEKRIELSILLGIAKHNIKCFKLFANMSCAFISIPWVAGIINKWLGWSCESLQEDIDVIQKELIQSF